MAIGYVITIQVLRKEGKMKFLKDLWASWKIKVTVVGGAIVIATAYGTCTVDPDKDAIKDAVLKEESKEGPKEAKSKEDAPSEAKTELPKKEEVKKSEEAPKEPVEADPAKE
tara:strand:+ start:1302 stop:1637 length:336 start_codon:yes stop_codon:yes gene_type:complete